MADKPIRHEDENTMSLLLQVIVTNTEVLTTMKGALEQACATNREILGTLKNGLGEKITLLAKSVDTTTKTCELHISTIKTELSGSLGNLTTQVQRVVDQLEKDREERIKRMEAEEERKTAKAKQVWSFLSSDNFKSLLNLLLIILLLVMFGAKALPYVTAFFGG